MSPPVAATPSRDRVPDATLPLRHGERGPHDTEPTRMLKRSPAAPVVTRLNSENLRVFLAAERTLLAWIRTGLALMGFGFLVAKFGVFLREWAAVREIQPDS